MSIYKKKSVNFWSTSFYILMNCVSVIQHNSFTYGWLKWNLIFLQFSRFKIELHQAVFGTNLTLAIFHAGTWLQAFLAPFIVIIYGYLLLYLFITFSFSLLLSSFSTIFFYSCLFLVLSFPTKSCQASMIWWRERMSNVFNIYMSD